MNVLIDTNVLLSAALRDRLPESVVLYVASRDEVRLIVTPDVLAEYSGVLRRPRFHLDRHTLSVGRNCSPCGRSMSARPRRRPTSLAIPKTRCFWPRRWRLMRIF